MLQWEVDKILWAYCTPATTITYLWAFLNGQHLKLKCKWKGRKHSYKQLFLPNIVIQPLLQKSKQHHFNQGMHKNQVKFTQKPWMQKQATERHVERCNYSSGKKHRYTDRNNQSSTILNIKILDILQRSARFQNLLSHDKLSAHYSLDSATNTIDRFLSSEQQTQLQITREANYSNRHGIFLRITTIRPPDVRLHSMLSVLAGKRLKKFTGVEGNLCLNLGCLMA
jgi:hypothetical protein